MIFEIIIIVPYHVISLGTATLLENHQTTLFKRSNNYSDLCQNY